MHSVVIINSTLAIHTNPHLEVRGADGLADHVPVVSTACDRELMLDHNVKELLADLWMVRGQEMRSWVHGGEK